jgi:signal transduction histidine kinase
VLAFIGLVVAETSALAAERGVRIETRTNGAATWVGAELRGLRQALARLVAAAIERSRPDSVVRLHVREHPDSATFLIEDEGPEPLPDGQLGLCVTRAIIEQHGGTLSLVNMKGGVFVYVELPRLACGDRSDQP